MSVGGASVTNMQQENYTEADICVGGSVCVSREYLGDPGISIGHRHMHRHEWNQVCLNLICILKHFRKSKLQNQILFKL